MTMIAPKPAGTRDNRVDFWRGIALIMIFINHVPGNFWEQFTSRNFGFSDAAELFVFLAGFAAAFAYGRPFLAGERLFATVKAWRRAGTLFLVQMTLTLLAIGLFAWAALAFGEGELMRRMNLTALSVRPFDAFFGLAIFGHQFGYVNILPMYVALLIMVPIHLWLASIRRELMLGFAIALWAASWAFRLNIPAYPNPGGWFFNPFAWQVIFAVGLYCGLRKASGLPSIPYKPWLLGLALAYLLFAFVTVRYGLWFLIYDLDFLPRAIASLDKTFAAVPRVLHVLALAYVFANAASHSPFSTVTRDNMLAAMGRNSLPVFAVGTMVALICQVIKFGRDEAFVFDTSLIAFGIAVQFALVWWLEWWGAYQKTVAQARRSHVQTANTPSPSSDPVKPSGAVFSGKSDRPPKLVAAARPSPGRTTPYS